MISYRTLPEEAVPARLLRSGEYSIRGTFDLTRQGGLYWFADALECRLRPQDGTPYAGLHAPAIEVYG